MQFKEALDLLAERYVERQIRPATYLEKRAFSGSDILSAIGQNPTLSHALIGAGVGAGVGGLSTAYANKDKPPEERSSLLRSMLTGGLAGGAMGGGLGAARQFAGNVGKPSILPLPDKEFTNPLTGNKVKIPGSVLAKNPELAARARELDAPIPAGEQAALAVAKAPGWIAKNLPISTAAIPGLGTLDALYHSSKLRLGDRFGIGAINPANTADPNHLRRGLTDYKGEDIPQAVKDKLLADDKGLAELAKKKFAPGDVGHKVTYDVPEPPLKPEVFKEGVRDGVNYREHVYEQHANTPKKFDTFTLSPAKLQSLKEQGVEAMHGKPLAEVPLMSRMGGTQWTHSWPRSVRLGGRVLPYLAIPGMEYAMWSALREQNKAKTLNELMQQTTGGR